MYTYKFYSDIKKNEIVICRKIELKIIMLKKVRLIRQILHILSHMHDMGFLPVGYE